MKTISLSIVALSFLSTFAHAASSDTNCDYRATHSWFNYALKKNANGYAINGEQVNAQKVADTDTYSIWFYKNGDKDKKVMVQASLVEGHIKAYSLLDLEENKNEVCKPPQPDVAVYPAGEALSATEVAPAK